MTTAFTVIISVAMICATVLIYKYIEENSVYVDKYELSDAKNNTDILRKQMDMALQELDEIQEQLKEQKNDSN